MTPPTKSHLRVRPMTSPPPPCVSTLSFVVWWPQWRRIGHRPDFGAIQLTPYRCAGLSLMVSPLKRGEGSSASPSGAAATNGRRGYACGR